MADEGEDSESLQGLLHPVHHSPQTLGESELSEECEGLEGPFQTDPASEESMTTETSETDRLCSHNESEEGEREEVATVQQQVVGEAEVAARPMASCDYRLQFSHGGELGGLLPVPEHGPLPPTQEQPSEQLLEQGAGVAASEMMQMASSAASETVETHSERNSESNSTAVSASISSRTGGTFSSQFTKAEPLSAKQQVALWLTRTSAQDIHQDFSVTSLRSLVNPGTQSNAAKYKKCKLPACSSKHAGAKKTEIQRNFSTKSLMERFTSAGSGSEGPGYSPIRKCETVLALSEVQSEVQSLARERGRASARPTPGPQPVVHRKKKTGGGEGMVSGSRMSLFKRLSKCGGSLAACGPPNLQATAPGDLAGSRTNDSPHPFPGLRPVNRLRSKSSILQCSRCTSVMSVATSRMTSRATSQMSLLLDRRYSRIHTQDDVLCKICCYDCPASAMVKLDECGCSFCKECMQQYIAFEVMEGAYDISCPDPDCPTQGVLSQHQMERLTDKELLDKHRTFRLNTEVSMDAARTWCPSAGCDTICHICAGTKSQGVPVSCPTCDKEFCSLCSATWHPGLSCAEHGAALVKRGGEPVDPFFLPDNCNDNIKRCPMCSVPIERDAGCAQMMCKRCKHVFCWYCLTSLDDDFLLRHYDSGDCQGKLGHSRASVIWHRAQVIGIFAGFGILLVLASPVLLVAAPCIICCKCRSCTKSELKSPSSDPTSSSKASSKGSSRSP